ncbi:MarR family winged helix-turn-helix transcriptional regulator [Paenibacillus daejeonensis]|uniref:MarR family winged helix-turn-helix transcriptional regulator n=1 Tax=Paenibacillus daejeonensis TaxID=135193 RepID=UPI0003795EEF|nr:MarR family transcriptional regulator [Paenibacillus daejeonensis]
MSDELCKSMLEDIIRRYEQAQFTVNRQLNVMMRDLIPEEITVDQYATLRYIHQQERCTSSELAEVFSVAKSSISAIITRLFDKQLIVREPDEKDRRVTYLALTEKGKAMSEELKKQIQERLAQYLGAFNTEEARHFIETYEKLARVLVETEEKGGRQA